LLGLPLLPAAAGAARPHAAEARALARFQAGRAILRCGGGRGRELALSFDDGPTALTPRLLALLDAHHVQATFFLIGRNIAPYARAVAAEAAAGDIGRP
jgi:peptidoglycan/xylan/chitin deacetylase (PgdA/CDA1 family)